MAPAAFTSPALPLRAAPMSSRTHVAPRCALPEVEENYPGTIRNAAPHISFSGNSGIFFSMARVKAFTEDTGEPPLFEYDEKDWTESKPVPAGPICWPAGDGRDVSLTGSRGSFTVGNDREYREAPPGGFFKRSMDG
jgi:hypothetical protein